MDHWEIGQHCDEVGGNDTRGDAMEEGFAQCVRREAPEAFPRPVERVAQAVATRSGIQEASAPSCTCRVASVGKKVN